MVNGEGKKGVRQLQARLSTELAREGVGKGEQRGGEGRGGGEEREGKSGSF